MESLEVVQARIGEAVAPARPADVAVREALGLVLAGRHRGGGAGPAVRQHRDGRLRGARGRHRGRAPRPSPVRLRVVGELPAGHAPDGAGRAGRGDPHHDRRAHPRRRRRDRDGGAHRARRRRRRAHRRSEVEPGRHVRAAGGDLDEGDEVFDAGTVLGPAHLGVLCSLGADRGPGLPACARRCDLHRRRAAGGTGRARAGSDPRLEPADAARARGGGGRDAGRPRDRPRRRGRGHRDVPRRGGARATPSSPPAACRSATTTS